MKVALRFSLIGFMAMIWQDLLTTAQIRFPISGILYLFASTIASSQSVSHLPIVASVGFLRKMRRLIGNESV